MGLFYGIDFYWSDPNFTLAQIWQPQSPHPKAILYVPLGHKKNLCTLESAQIGVNIICRIVQIKQFYRKFSMNFITTMGKVHIEGTGYRKSIPILCKRIDEKLHSIIGAYKLVFPIR